MKTTTKELPKSQIELTVELSAEEIKSQLDKATANISNDVKITGFRPGKANYEVVAKKVGEAAIYQEASQLIIEKTYPQAVIESKIYVVGQPKIEIIKMAPNNPFIYKATVALLPSVELADYKDIKARREDIKVEDKDVEKAIDQLRKMRATHNPIDRPAQSGDFVEIDFTVSRDKVQIDGGASKNHPLVIGEGNFISGFEDNLVGMIKGQTKEFQLTFPKDYQANNLAGQKADFKVTMHKIFEVKLPEFNDDFVKQLGDLGNVSTFRKKISENLKDEANNRADRGFEEAIVNELAERTKFGELPDIMLESEIDKMLAELESEVASRGMEWGKYLESIKKTKDDLLKEFRPQAEKRVKAALLIRHIAQEEKVEVSAEEIKKETEETKKRYENDPDIQKKIETPAYRQYVENLLANRKVIQFLRSQTIK
ncbi:trigger factor [Patescibacteria group bacterium]